MKKLSVAKGFTLIELSIVMIIAGLALTAMLAMLNATMAGRDRKTTIANLQNAENALKSYLAMNGAFPCPAPRGVRRGEEGYGEALPDCLVKEDRAISMMTTEEGIARAEGRDGRRVLIGILPFRSLGISDAEGADGWDNLLQYAVTETLTDPALYDQDQGGIDIVADTEKSRIVPAGSAQYAILSSGADGLGGFLKTGERTPDKCPPDLLQTENCDDDSVFMESESRVATKTNNRKRRPVYLSDYDDYIAYLQYDPQKGGAGGLLFYYDEESCPPAFTKIGDEDLHVAGIRILSSYDSGGTRPRKKDAPPAEPLLCYSSRYGTSMMISAKSDKEPTLCPDGWDNIGYRKFGMDESGDPQDAVFYQFCAR